MSIWHVNPIFGVDTQAGTEGAPVKTIAKALALAASTTADIGDTIVLNDGIYRETIEIPAGKAPYFFGRGMAIVDGELIRPCIDQATSATAAGARSYWQNVIFRNAGADASGDFPFIVKHKDEGAGTFSGFFVFFNCAFYNDAVPAADGVVASIDNVTNFCLELHNCTINRLNSVLSAVNLTAATPDNDLVITNGIIKTSVTANPLVLQAVGTATVTGLTVTYSTNAFPGASGTGNLNLTVTVPPFADESFPNPDLSLDYSGGTIASYRGTGTDGRNKGASWDPAFGWDGLVRSTIAEVGPPAWRDPVTGVDWISDPNYPAGSTEGAAVRINDANGDHWEINTQALPTATSAAVVSPVMKKLVQTGVDSDIRKALWGAVEDTAPSAGSKKVVDSTSGDSARTIQYRAQTGTFTIDNNAIAWVDVDKTADLSGITFTADYHFQIRVILRLNGQ